MGISVLNDAQFGLTATLRPYVGFDAQPGGVGTGSYQGVSTIFPILFSEGGMALDPLAGQPGYSKRLVKGVQVPFGARVSIWVPATNLFGLSVYQWFVIWRQRNVFDYRFARLPFHYPKQGVGQADTTPGDTGPRVVIPTCFNTIIFNGSGDSLGGGSASTSDTFGTSAPEIVKVPSLAAFFGGAPLIPPVQGIAPASQQFGIIEQGVTNPFTAGQADAVASWNAWEVQAIGDEMIIGCTKSDTLRNGGAGPGIWDFTLANSAGGDLQFSALLGSGTAPNITGPFPDFGVYVNIGVAT